MTRFVVAIDGPAGAGKGTVARLVAGRLGFLHVDTGAMYRAFTLKALRLGVPLENPQLLTAMAVDARLELEPAPGGCRVILDGEDVSEAIRAEEVSRSSHAVSSVRDIREILWRLQRSYRETHDLVMEGRDIGSVVFPDAQVKVYLDATPAERARRRWLQLREKGVAGDLSEIEREIIERDRKDSSRNVAPLVRLPDAVYLDSTGMTVEEEVGRIVDLVEKARAAPSTPRL